MIRRRRTQREIPFSFDSFLDVVANVVGIILRLILVAWVGARSYHSDPVSVSPPVVQQTTADAGDSSLPHDPLADEIEQRRRELEAAQQRLLDQLHQWEQAKDQKTQAERELSAAAERVEGLKSQRAASEQAAMAKGKEVRTAVLSLPEVETRIQLVNADLDALKKLPPPPKHSLTYKTPVSQALQSEELFFECHGGRVTVIDIGAMLEEMRRDRAEKTKLLSTQWEVDGVTGPVGAFRMNYALERERGPAAGPAGSAPVPEAEFSYNISWMIEPVIEERGEAEAAALTPKSDFLNVVDSVDPKVTAVTFWVYSDSFPVYRQLRDLLHKRGFVVAGRPLLEGMPIGSSRHGTASRGQ
jgi:hypothetical protein